MIQTSIGLMDEGELERFTIKDEDEYRIITKSGYKHNGVIVQQDVNIVVKKMPGLLGEIWPSPKPSRPVSK